MRRAAFPALVSLALAQSAGAATLVVRAEGIESAERRVLVAVCARSFDEAGCPYGTREAAKPWRMDFVLRDIPPGSYAVAVYHDINRNGRLDTIPPGIPTEPYGFSNDVGRLAPPSFQGALLRISEGTSTVAVRVRRLLPGG